MCENTILILTFTKVCAAKTFVGKRWCVLQNAICASARWNGFDLEKCKLILQTEEKFFFLVCIWLLDLNCCARRLGPLFSVENLTSLEERSVLERMLFKNDEFYRLTDLIFYKFLHKFSKLATHSKRKTQEKVHVGLSFKYSFPFAKWTHSGQSNCIMKQVQNEQIFDDTWFSDEKNEWANARRSF